MSQLQKFLAFWANVCSRCCKVTFCFILTRWYESTVVMEYLNFKGSLLVHFLLLAFSLAKLLQSSLFYFFFDVPNVSFFCCLFHSLFTILVLVQRGLD